MHKSAMLRMKWFVENYIPKDTAVKVLDVGSFYVNGSYRSLFIGTQAEYVGLDVSSGPNVDIVPKDPYQWDEIEDESFDFIISGNAFEHIEYPWLTIKEIYKKLKPGGFICILAPFAHVEHRFPVDCYRYLSDGFVALAKWANFQVVEATVGGIPKDTKDPEWADIKENYDDTVLIAAKCTTEKVFSLLDCPKFGSTKLTKVWKDA